MNNIDGQKSFKIAVIGDDYPVTIQLILACYLAQSGLKVSLFVDESEVMTDDHNDSLKFGPSWLVLLPALEEFYLDMDTNIQAELNLKKLENNYKIYMNEDEIIIGSLKDTRYKFSEIEPGSGIDLENFLRGASKLNKNINTSNWLSRKLNTKRGSLGGYEHAVNSVFYSEKLRRAMRVVPELYFGPGRLPMASKIINNLDLTLPQNRIKGGYGELLSSILGLAKRKGVQIYDCSKIKEISYDENSCKVKIDRHLLDFDKIIYSGAPTILARVDRKAARQKNEVGKLENVSWQWSLLLKTKLYDLEFHNILVDDGLHKFIQNKLSGKLRRSYKKLVPIYLDYYDKISRQDLSNLCVSLILPRIAVADDVIVELKECILRSLEIYLEGDIRDKILKTKENIVSLRPDSRLNQMISATEHKNIYELKAPISLEMLTTQAVYSSRRFIEQTLRPHE